MDKVKTGSSEEKPVPVVQLFDCGQASKVTKGVPFMILFEFGPAPFDRALVL